MSTTEVLLVLVGVPIVVIAVIWALAYGGGPSAQKRYRPGRPHEFAPVWYLANHGGQQPPRRPELEPARPALPQPGGDVAPQPVGGASERW